MVINFRKENGILNLKIILSLILVIIIIGFVFFHIFNSKKETVILEKIPYEYFVLYSLDNNIGVIDKKGKTIINAEYNEIYIPNQSKDVFICNKENANTILNSQGKEIFTDYENVSPIMISETNLEMEKYLLTYKKDNKYGILTIDGKKVTDAIYTEVSSLKGKPGNILVKKDDKYGVIDSSGKIIIEAKYNYIKSDEYFSETEEYLKTGYIVSEKTKEGIFYGYIDYSGKEIVKTKYESLVRAMYEDSDDIYLIVMERGKKGVLENGKELIKNNFQSINYFNKSRIFAVEKTGKYGFYTIDGKEILKPEFSEYKIAGNYISVKKDDKTLLYDIHGNVVNTSNYVEMVETNNPSYFIAKDEKGYYSIISKDVTLNENYTSLEYAFGDYFIYSKENEKTGLLNVWEGTVVEPEYEYIVAIEGTNMIEGIKEDGTVDIYSKKIEKIVTMSGAVVEKKNENYIVVYSDEEMIYLDKEGNIVKNTEVFPDNKLFAIKKDGKWGFSDITGNVKVSCKYDMVTEINEYGFAGVKQDNTWGVIDENGNNVVIPSYNIEYYYFPQFVGKYLLQQSETVQCLELEE